MLNKMSVNIYDVDEYGRLKKSYKSLWRVESITVKDDEHITIKHYGGELTIESENHHIEVFIN